jgi:hypothetical protein
MIVVADMVEFPSRDCGPAERERSEAKPRGRVAPGV